MTQAYTNRFTEVHGLGAGYFPGTHAIGTHWTAWTSMSNHQRAVFILGVGAMAAGATLDVRIWQATDAAGTDAKVVAGKLITTLTQAGGDGNDSIAIELRAEELDVDNKFCYVAAAAVVAGNTADMAGCFYLGASNYPPVSVANWTEIVD